MGKSKSVKRKQNAQLDNPRKQAKTAPTNGVITPPPDGSGEPTSLQTIISTEELEITVDTLNTLASYPGLIKTKPCKDLRVAAYDFRQACTTGSISASTFSCLRQLWKYLLQCMNERDDRHLKKK